MNPLLYIKYEYISIKINKINRNIIIVAGTEFLDEINFCLENYFFNYSNLTLIRNEIQYRFLKIGVLIID